LYGIMPALYACMCFFPCSCYPCVQPRANCSFTHRRTDLIPNKNVICNATSARITNMRGNRGFKSLGSGRCNAAVRRVLKLCHNVSLQHGLLECRRIVLHGEALCIHQILRGREPARSEAGPAARSEHLDLQAHARHWPLQNLPAEQRSANVYTLLA